MDISRRFRLGNCSTCFYAEAGKNKSDEDTYFCMRCPPTATSQIADVFPEVSGDFRCGEYSPDDEVMLEQILEKGDWSTVINAIEAIVEGVDDRTMRHQELVIDAFEGAARRLRKAAGM